MGKQDDIVKLHITIDLGINLILERTASKLGIDEGTAIKVAIERGMERYWSRWFDEMAADLEVLKERYLECQKDNRLLRALLAQNEELRRIIGRAEKGLQ
jgi:hypothetical protein